MMRSLLRYLSRWAEPNPPPGMVAYFREGLRRAKDQQDDLITAAAKKHDLWPDLVRAIIEVESGGDPLAMRFEPEWRWHLDVTIPGVSKATERNQQATSWGLMQVMGTVAREHGFLGQFMSALCDPAMGLDYGCRHLSKMMRRYEGSVWHAVAAYNAGTAKLDVSGRFVNQAYVDKVRVALETAGSILTLTA